MMSPTTSLGSPFSAESCARPVTSSRFIAGAPLFFNWRSAPLRGDEADRLLFAETSARSVVGDKKSGVDPLSAAPAAPGHRPEVVEDIVSKRCNGRLAAAGFLCEVVPDHRE